MSETGPAFPAMMYQGQMTLYSADGCPNCVMKGLSPYPECTCGGNGFASTTQIPITAPATGLTKREYAAIHLRVPTSGTDWLDEMIREARRMDLAGKAAVEHGDPKALFDAMLAERGRK